MHSDPIHVTFHIAPIVINCDECPDPIICHFADKELLVIFRRTYSECGHLYGIIYNILSKWPPPLAPSPNPPLPPHDPLIPPILSHTLASALTAANLLPTFSRS